MMNPKANPTALSLTESSWRKGACALLTGASLLGASVLAAFPAAAQQVATPYTPQQCELIRNNILGIFKRYDGKISAEFVADLQEFSRKNCDRAVKIRMIPGTHDKDAASELKVLIASRISSLDRTTPR